MNTQRRPVHAESWHQPPVSETGTDPGSVIPIRPERDQRERRRRLVQTATIREYSGRSWERDHVPAVGAAGHNDGQWLPVVAATSRQKAARISGKSFRYQR